MLAEIPHELPTPEETRLGSEFECTACGLTWALRFRHRHFAQRCLNCGRRARREEKERGRNPAAPFDPSIVSTVERGTVDDVVTQLGQRGRIEKARAQQEKRTVAPLPELVALPGQREVERQIASLVASTAPPTTIDAEVVESRTTKAKRVRRK